VKKIVPALVVLVLVGVFLACTQADMLPRPTAQADTVKTEGAALQVYFSPKGGCTEAIVAELGKAKESVLIQAYSFTSAPMGTPRTGPRASVPAPWLFARARRCPVCPTP